MQPISDQTSPEISSRPKFSNMNLLIRRYSWIITLFIIFLWLFHSVGTSYFGPDLYLLVTTIPGLANALLLNPILAVAVMLIIIMIELYLVFFRRYDRPSHPYRWIFPFLMAILAFLSIQVLGNIIVQPQTSGGFSLEFYETLLFFPFAFFVFSILTLTTSPNKKIFQTLFLINIALTFIFPTVLFGKEALGKARFQNEKQTVSAVTSLIDCKKFKFVDTWRSCVKKYFVTVEDYSTCISISQFDMDTKYCDQLKAVATDNAISQSSDSIQICNNLNSVEGLALCLLKNLRNSNDFEYCRTNILLKGYSNLDRTNCYVVYAFRQHDQSICQQMSNEGSYYPTECKRRLQVLENNGTNWFTMGFSK